MIRLILIIITVIITCIVTLFVFPFTRLVGLFSRHAQDMICLRFVQFELKVGRFLSGAKVEYVGLENLPGKGEGVVYIANHRGFFDIIATYPVFPDRTGFIAKKEMRTWPLIGWWMSSVYCLFLDRNDHRQGVQTIFQGSEYVKQGISMFVFPEGTRSKVEGEMLPFKRGSFKLATRVGAPIIPIAIHGSGLIFDDHFPTVKAGKVRVEFMERIETKDLSPEEIQELPARVHDLIEEKVKAYADIQ